MKNDEFESLLVAEHAAASLNPGKHACALECADFRCAGQIGELIARFPDDPLWLRMDAYDWWRVLKFRTGTLPIMPDITILPREHWFSILLSQPERVTECPYEWTKEELAILCLKQQ